MDRETFRKMSKADQLLWLSRKAREDGDYTTSFRLFAKYMQLKEKEEIDCKRGVLERFSK